MKEEKPTITKVPINELKASEYNPRKAAEREYKDLSQSIKRFGMVDPVIVNSANNRENIIIGGHFRIRVAKDLGYKEVPVVYVNISEIEKEKELNLRLNKNLGEFDFDLLANFNENVLKDVGFDSDELDEIFQLDPEPKDDEVPEIRKTTIKLGDMFKLDEHRLLCGDAMKREDVERLIGKNKSYNVLTDPPYNVDFNYNKYSDKKDVNQYEHFCKEWFDMLKPIGMIFTPGPRNERIYPKPKDKGIWLKRNATAGASVFNLRCCEPIYFYGEFSKKTNFDYFDVSSGFLNELKNARKKSGVLKQHAPAKPIKLWLELLKMFNKKPVVDCFCGNGTTIISCEKLGRIGLGLEIDPQYCQVIIDRWEQYTGEKVKKQHNNRTK